MRAIQFTAFLLLLPACNYWPQAEASTVEFRQEPQVMQHELIAVQAYVARATDARSSRPFEATELASRLDGWTVVVRTDVSFSEEHQRLYFTDVRYDGWLLWGLTDCDTKTIFLADDILSSGVLAHEYGHAFDQCRTSHEEQRAHGYDDAVAEVQKALVPASGLFEGNQVVDGVKQ